MKTVALDNGTNASYTIAAGTGNGGASVLFIDGGTVSGLIASKENNNIISAPVVLERATTLQTLGTATLTLTGPISNGTTGTAGTVTISGSGKVVLASSSQSYGAITVSGGSTLELGGTNPAAFGTGIITNGGTINFGETGTLLFNRTDFTGAALAAGGTGSFFQTGSGTTTLGGAQTFSGILGTKAGTLILGTLGTYTGGLVVQGGTMQIPTDYTTNQIQVSGTGKFDINGHALTAPILAGSGSGAITNSSATANVVNLPMSAGTQSNYTYGGIFTGNLGVNIFNSVSAVTGATLTLTGANSTFTGKTALTTIGDITSTAQHAAVIVYGR